MEMTSLTDTSKRPDTEPHRANERTRLVYYLRVFDADTGLLLGHVANISTGGIKLVSHDPPELNRAYMLKLILPKEVSGRSELLFAVKSCWAEPDSNPDFIITGFSFRSLSDEQAAQIDAVHDEFGRDTTLSPVTTEHPACNLTHTTGR